MASKVRFKIPDPAYEQGPGENRKSFLIFTKWLESSGRICHAELADMFGVSIDTIRRYSRKFQWRERLQRVKGLSTEIPESIAIPDNDPIKAFNEGDYQSTNARVMGADEVLSGTYFAMSGLYAKLLRAAEIAINQIDGHSITSMSEIKALMGLTLDLQKAKVDLANQLLGIEELARAVQQLRKARGR